LSYELAGIRRTLLLKSNSVPLLGKTVPANVWVLQRGLLFLFVHCFNEGCYVERRGDRWRGPLCGKGNPRNTFMKGVLTLTPLTPRRITGHHRIDRHLKYYIYIIGYPWPLDTVKSPNFFKSYIFRRNILF
jgi:hypothetical protein